MESGHFPLEKYSKWTGNNWQPPVINSSNSLFIVIQDGHLLVVNCREALESVSLLQNHFKINAACKDDTLAVETKFQDISAKFRIQFQHNHDANVCLKLLEKYINILNAGVAQRVKASSLTMSQLLTEIMKNTPASLQAPDSICENYPFEAGIHLCLLDPGFPRLLAKVEKILDSYK